MKIIVSLFHTINEKTLYVLDGSLNIIKDISTIGFNNAKGIAIARDKIIVTQKDEKKDCYLVLYSKEDFSELNKVLIKETKDVHSICVFGGDLAVVSTGTNEVHYYNLKNIFNQNEVDPVRKQKTSLTHDVTTDLIHLNGVALRNNRLIISGFGLKNQDDRWNKALGGFVLDLDSNKNLNDTSLLQPHSIFVNNYLYYCESGKGKIYKDNEVIMKVDEGYSRGLFVTNDSKIIFVGISSRFYQEINVTQIKPKVAKYLLDSHGNYVLNESLVFDDPGSEIYDIVCLD